LQTWQSMNELEIIINSWINKAVDSTPV